MGLLGAALKIGGSIFGGIKASKAAKKAKGYVESQKAKNDVWFKKAYNEDITQRADAQNMLTHVEDSIRARNKMAAGTAAVMGGTTASVAAEKAANNQALADATAQIAANAANRKDLIEQQYQNQDNALTGELINIEQNRAKNISSAVQNGLGTAADAISGLKIPGKPAKQETQETQE